MDDQVAAPAQRSTIRCFAPVAEVHLTVVEHLLKAAREAGVEHDGQHPIWRRRHCVRQFGVVEELPVLRDQRFAQLAVERRGRMSTAILGLSITSFG